MPRRSIRASSIAAVCLLVLLSSAATTLAGDRMSTPATPLYLSTSAHRASAAACALQNHNDTVGSFYSGIAVGERYATFIDPANCGDPATYPFEIQDISLTFIHFPGAQWPLTVDIEIRDPAGADSCGGPGSILCSETVTLDSAAFALPNIGTISLASPCCVSGPFYVTINYTGASAAPYPSVVFASDAPAPLCMNWAYVGGAWNEWSDLWADPVPGNIIVWVEGETNSANCGPRVVLNELNVQPGQTGAELLEYRYQWIELYNAGSADADLTGWTLADSSGLAIASLPSWTLPAQSFLTIHWDTGVDDNDFSDSDGHYYLNDTSRTFPRDHGEVGLFSGIPGPATIEDFLIWGNDPSITGASYNHAVASGIWAPGGIFDPGVLLTARTIGRVFNGWDTDASGDWMVYGWLQYIVPGITQPFNPAQFAPEKNLVLTISSPTFEWHGCSTVGLYQLQVDNDPDFSSPLIDTILTDTAFTATSLADGVYSFRIRGWFGGQPTAWSAAWIFMVYPALPTPRDANNCPFKWQHKDTRLLCIWDPTWQTRPGCVEHGAHAWDAPHPDGPPPEDEPHCGMYCARASIAMVNEKYGGDLSQDRISYHYFREISDRVAGPEGDMGHGEALWNIDFVNTISWALNGAAINSISAGSQPGNAFSFDSLKAWVDRLDCFVTNIPGHVVVTNDYTDFTFQAHGQNIDVEVAHIHDPARGASQPKIFRWQVNGSPQPQGWNHTITWVFLQPEAGVSGRNQEASVTIDSDGDGIMDFDEQNPRAFHCVHNDPDTDDDQVVDKNEIRNYTFHDTTGYHDGHDNDALNFPDIDGDSLRAENDCDSDNDSDFDGGEDINGDGHNPVTTAGDVCSRETCQFDNSELCLAVNVDKPVYQLGEPVFIVDAHGSRPTHTYHENSTYNYEKGAGCPDKNDGDALGHNGAFTTDANGHARRTFVEHCLFPGQRYLTVDVLDDNLYSEPDNLDPQTCWECAADWFHGWHWAYDYPYHNPTFNYPQFAFPRVCEGPPSSDGTNYLIEVPWWWWCFTWPPPVTEYWLGVSVPIEIVELSLASIAPVPIMTFETEECAGLPLNFYNPDPAVTADLQTNFSDGSTIWTGFKIEDWTIPDSLMTTRVHIQVHGGTGSRAVDSFQVQIIAGDATYGWSPTVYDSIWIPFEFTGCCLLRGDANSDGNVNVGDLTFLVAYLFNGGPPPPCQDHGDTNADSLVNVGDLTFLVNYLFKGGPPPPGC